MSLAVVSDYNPTPEPGTPEWWRDRLLKRLEEEQQPRVALYERYYQGDHPLPSPPQRMLGYAEARTAFENLSTLGITNYVKLVPDAPAERLRVEGFRFGEVENAKADPEAWRIWQRNHLDADADALHHKALVTGQTYMLVWPGPDGADITVEHPSQAIVGYEPGSFRRRAAGLKSWLEDDGQKRMVLYLPDAVYKWTQLTAEGAPAGEIQRWQPGGETWPITNPLGKVPLVEFRANPDLRPCPYGGGQSEFATVLPIQNRINKTIFDRLVTAEYQAFRQRWAIGWTPDNPNEGMRASMSHLLTFEDSEVQVGEFSQADFGVFIKAVESDVQAMAAITRTPTFYTLGVVLANISGDTLTALQAGLFAKTESHRDNFSESHEEVLRLALRAENNPRAADEQTMVLWRDIEHRTLAEKADAAVKLASVGVPREALWAMVGATPQDIARWKVMSAAEELLRPTAGPQFAQTIDNAMSRLPNGG